MQRRAPGGFGPFGGTGYARGYGRRRDPYMDHHAVRLLLALAQQVAMMDRKPPVTLLLAALNVLLFISPQGLGFDAAPSIKAGCLQPSSIIYKVRTGSILMICGKSQRRRRQAEHHLSLPFACRASGTVSCGHHSSTRTRCTSTTTWLRCEFVSS